MPKERKSEKEEVREKNHRVLTVTPYPTCEAQGRVGRGIVIEGMKLGLREGGGKVFFQSLSSCFSVHKSIRIE